MLIISNTENKGDYTAQIQAFSGNYSPINIEVAESQQTVVEDFSQPITVEAEEVTSVSANGITYTPAINPESPQNGEYLWNPYSQQLQIFAENLPRSIQVSTPPPTIPVSPPLLREPHPISFKNLPLEGTIQLNRSFEQHPSATAQFEIALPKSIIQQVLSPGLEINIYGLPLRIENLDITELPRAIYPDMRCTVKINFGGKWENYIDEPVFLRDDGNNNLILDNQPDPDCAIGIRNNSNNKRETTVIKLLRKAGIPYTGAVLKPVPIDRDTPRDATADPISLLQERLRVANSFVRWSNPGAVEVVRINSTKAWFYRDTEILGEISTSYDAIAISSKRRSLSIANYNPPSPNLATFPSSPTPPPIPTIRNELPTNLSFEYPNVELSGEFSQPKDKDEEKTQGQSTPRYVRKDPKRRVRIDGDVKANEFPAGTSSIQVMSMCFDLGGVTKSRQFVHLEDEAEVKIITEIFGFVFTAGEIYDDSRKRILGNPRQQWKLIKQTTTEFTYDKQTGYLLYEIESGFNTVRYRKESVEIPETLEDGNPEAHLYRFFQLPIYKRTSRYLQKFEEYSSENAVDWVKKCDRFGKAFLSPVYNPDFAPPYYSVRERTESAGFASTDNPENEGLSAEDKRMPDLVVGEESLFETTTNIEEAVYEQSITTENGNVVYLRGEEITPAKVHTYSIKYKAQGEGMTEALQETSTTETEGEPTVAKRRPNRFKKEEEDVKDKAEKPEEAQYRYLIQTPGYSYQNLIGGSESFPVAETLQEALTAARCKLAIENWRNGLTESLQIPGNLGIKEGDRFNYICNGEYRQRVVLSVAHNLEIQGVVNGDRRITAVTSLSLGRYVLPPLSYTKHKIPKPGEQEPLKGSALLIWRVNLGQILPLVGRHRRNP
jgi:hypothetical protein